MYLHLLYFFTDNIRDREMPSKIKLQTRAHDENTGHSEFILH